MALHLAKNVQVRKESWGLLFYSPARHGVSFIKSGDWLHPQHFDGTWTFEDIAGDIAGRTGTPVEIIERTLPKLTERLKTNRIIANELR